jgi:REP element-mobilizing transposase RayT
VDDEKKSSAAVPPAVEGASRPRFGEVEIRDRGRLPHWETESGVYFVTFRLHDSAPQSLRQEIAERKTLPIKLPHDPRPSVKEMEEYLDRSEGACYRRQPEVAEVVANAIHHLDAKHYRLMAWVVMPNHVHLLFKLLPGKSLSKTMHSLKSYTAKEANRFLGRTGPFWQREYYDRLIRDGAELDRAIAYIHANPEKAGLRNWKWIG